MRIIALALIASTATAFVPSPALVQRGMRLAETPDETPDEFDLYDAPIPAEPMTAELVDVEASVEVDTPTEEEDPAFEMPEFEMPEFEMPDFSDLAEEISAKFEEAKEALAKMFEE
jgi:hypothetical protein